MDIRDTVSRVLLGIAFGFVMGIVMYQAAGIDAGVIDKGSVSAELETCEDKGQFSCGFEGLCCQTAGDCNVYTGTCDTITYSSSSTPICSAPNYQCGGFLNCCTPDESCNSTTGECFLPDDSSSSSTTSDASSSSSGGCCNMTTNSCE